MLADLPDPAAGGLGEDADPAAARENDEEGILFGPDGSGPVLGEHEVGRSLLSRGVAQGAVFGALADPTRRAVFERVARSQEITS